MLWPVKDDLFIEDKSLVRVKRAGRMIIAMYCNTPNIIAHK